jgi:hypothetical protein
MFRADLWYVKHVLSVCWRLAWPCVLTMTAVTVVSLAIKLPWRYSLVQAPGVSVLDATVCLWAGYYTSRRTRLVHTGMMSAALIGVLVTWHLPWHCGRQGPGAIPGALRQTIYLRDSVHTVRSGNKLRFGAWRTGRGGRQPVAVDAGADARVVGELTSIEDLPFNIGSSVQNIINTAATCHRPDRHCARLTSTAG